jgi:hypothetical protein
MLLHSAVGFCADCILHGYADALSVTLLAPLHHAYTVLTS